MNDFEYTQNILPSNGIPYINGAGAPLIPNGELAVRGMYAPEEAMFNEPSVPVDVRLGKIIDACTRFPAGVTSSDLIAGDYLYLGLIIRVLTHGPHYKLSSTCGSCGSPAVRDINVVEDVSFQNLPRTHFKTMPDGTRVEHTCHYDPKTGIEVTLPESGHTVWMRLLPQRDIFDARRLITAASAPGTGGRAVRDVDHARNILGEMLANNPASWITKIYSITAYRLKDSKDIIKTARDPIGLLNTYRFLKPLKVRDFRHIERAYEMHDIDTVQEVQHVCAKCGAEFPLHFVVNLDFFRGDDAEDAAW